MIQVEGEAGDCLQMHFDVSEEIECILEDMTKTEKAAVVDRMEGMGRALNEVIASNVDVLAARIRTELGGGR